MNELTIGNITIHRKGNNLFSLNDWHNATGGEPRHQPANFMRLDTTQGLINELNALNVKPAFLISQGGNDQGTFGCKELVYSYALWINPAFHIQIIKGYDELNQGPDISRSTSVKQPSLSKQIEFARAIEKMGRVIREAVIATDPFAKAQYLAIIKNYCDLTGTECIDPALIGTRTFNENPAVAHFWDTFESINGGDQNLFNHSCSPDQEIIIKLSQIYSHCRTIGISLPDHNTLRPLLLKSERYRYAGNAGVWSRLWRKSVWCLIFTKD